MQADTDGEVAISKTRAETVCTSKTSSHGAQ